MRYLARHGGAAPNLIVLTKAEVRGAEERKAEVESIAAGVPVHAISSKTGDGLDALRASGCRKIFACRPEFPAGRPILVSALVGKELMLDARDLGDDDALAAATTMHELVRAFDGLLILDTPGMRELPVDASAGVRLLLIWKACSPRR